MNEISLHSQSIAPSALLQRGVQLLDDHYGRILKRDITSPYADARSLDFYVQDSAAEIVDILRVPFRKVPVFKFTNIQQIEQLVNKLTKANPEHTVLLRGQAKFYPIKRDPEENMFLYGDESPKEPSFHPSFLRENFNEFFIYNLWHSQVAMMLNDIAVDLSRTLTVSQTKEYYDDVTKIKGSTHFTPIALGIAQHYGLPSIGLDLTKDIMVASWFASHKILVESDGATTVQPITDFSESTIYIFRCPNDSVFSHGDIKPKFIVNTRPDRQDAWFGHAGWGLAKNQLAGYLMAGVRLDESILTSFKNRFDQYLFPTRDEDVMLNFFLDVRQNEKYMGEARRALNKIYHLTS